MCDYFYFNPRASCWFKAGLGLFGSAEVLDIMHRGASPDHTESDKMKREHLVCEFFLSLIYHAYLMASRLGLANPTHSLDTENSIPDTLNFIVV